jgi:hypothetical protein
MAYFINPVEDDRCVLVSYAGEMPSVELSAARREATGVMGERHWNRLLIDVTQMQSVPTPAQLFDLTKAISAEVPRGARVALLIRPEQVHSARLVERIARSDGVFLAYFLDSDKAMAWVKPVKVPRQSVGHNWRKSDEHI